MMDERQRVIRSLLIELHKAGINPDRPFFVDFIPGQPPRFHEDDDEELSAPSVREPASSLREESKVPNATIPRTKVQPR